MISINIFYDNSVVQVFYRTMDDADPVIELLGQACKIHGLRGSPVTIVHDAGRVVFAGGAIKGFAVGDSVKEHKLSLDLRAEQLKHNLEIKKFDEAFDASFKEKTGI